MRVVCAGDCGVDRYVDLDVDRPGGKTLNTAVTARRIFDPDDRVEVVTVLGRDPESGLVTEALARFGLSGSIRRGPGRTSVQYIDRAPSGEKIFLRYDQGVLAGHRIDADARRRIAACDLLVTPLYAEIHDFFDSVIEAPSAGLRAVDFSDLDDFGRGVDVVERYGDRFDIGFFGLQVADRALTAALEQLARRRGKLFVVTFGPDGSLAVGGDRRRAQPALAVDQIVDTTGAGDVFAAGFLQEYCTSRDVPASLATGARVAAESIQRVGAF